MLMLMMMVIVCKLSGRLLCLQGFLKKETYKIQYLKGQLNGFVGQMDGQMTERLTRWMNVRIKQKKKKERIVDQIEWIIKRKKNYSFFLLVASKNIISLYCW